MTTWVGLAPAVGVGSLNGFAIGVLVSGAFSLAIIAPRRARGRRATVARDGGTLANGRPPRPSRQVMAAGPEGPVTRDDVGLSFPAGREGRAGNEYRSRHRLGDPIPDWALPRGRFRHGAPSGSAPPGSAPRDAGARAGLPGGAQPDLAFPDGTFGTSLPPGVRRPPRHAAPAVRFADGTTGPFAARTLASGAHG